MEKCIRTTMSLPQVTGTHLIALSLITFCTIINFIGLIVTVAQYEAQIRITEDLCLLVSRILKAYR